MVVAPGIVEVVDVDDVVEVDDDEEGTVVVVDVVVDVPTPWAPAGARSSGISAKNNATRVATRERAAPATCVG